MLPCSTCKCITDATQRWLDFYSVGVKPICPDCHQKRISKYCPRRHTSAGTLMHGKNRRTSRAKELRLRAFRKLLIEQHLATHGGCQQCGYVNKDSLEWHHVNPSTKLANVSEASTMKGIMTERAKCILLCRMCHAIETHKRFPGPSSTSPKLQERLRAYINDAKRKAGQCTICKRSKDLHEHPYAFEWDHVEPSTKFMSVSLLAILCANTNIIDQELAKCRLLCGNCHMSVTRVQQRQYLVKDQMA